MVTSDGTHLFVVGLVERVQVFLLTAFLLFLGNLQRSKILLELAFDNPVLILGVLEGNLCFLLQVGQLISVLEHEMHQALHVNLDLNLMFFFQILKLSLLVSELGLFVFKLLLTDHPEIADSDTFIVVHKS